MSRKSGGTKVRSSLEGTEAVDEFMRTLDHPLKPVLEAVKKIILGVNPGIGEGIKWNAPSFHYKDYFATGGLRSKDFVHVIFQIKQVCRASTLERWKLEPGKDFPAVTPRLQA